MGKANLVSWLDEHPGLVKQICLTRPRLPSVFLPGGTLGVCVCVSAPFDGLLKHSCQSHLKECWPLKKNLQCSSHVLLMQKCHRGKEKKTKTWCCGSVHAGRRRASQFFFPFPITSSHSYSSAVYRSGLEQLLRTIILDYGIHTKKIRMDWNIVYRREEDGQRWGVEIRADLPTDYSDMLGYILHFHILITHTRPVQPGIHHWVPGPMPNHFTGCGLFLFLV